MFQNLMNWCSGCVSTILHFGNGGRRRKTCAGVNGEQLETKTLLAGAVAVGIVADTLIVAGDNMDNNVTVTRETNGRFIVEGSDTQLFYKGVPVSRIVTPGGLKDIACYMGKGADRVGITSGRDGLSIRNVTISGGVGGDEILVDRLNLHSLSIEGGKGPDSIKVIDCSIDKGMYLDGGQGRDTLGVFNTSVRGISRIKFQAEELDRFFASGFRAKGGLEFGL